jgi:hypothetical protein
VSGDGADPDRLAAFWAVAVGDVPEPGHDDAAGASIVDPDDVAPAIGLLRVPEQVTGRVATGARPFAWSRTATFSTTS